MVLKLNVPMLFVLMVVLYFLRLKKNMRGLLCPKNSIVKIFSPPALSLRVVFVKFSNGQRFNFEGNFLLKGNFEKMKGN